MKLIWTIVFATIFPAAGFATDAPLDTAVPGAVETPDEPLAEAPNPDEELVFLDATDVDLTGFLWERRLVIVMADTPNDPAFIRQIRELRDRADEMVARDVVVVTDTDPAAFSDLRRLLRPNGFMTVIISKEGEVTARRPSPRSGRELMAVIDRLPLRRQEMLDNRPAGR